MVKSVTFFNLYKASYSVQDEEGWDGTAITLRSKEYAYKVEIN